MREMSAPRPRVTAAKSGREDGFDEEAGRIGRTDNDDDNKHAPKVLFPWRRFIVIAMLCVVSLGGASRLLSSGSRGDDGADIVGAKSQDVSNGKVHKTSQGKNSPTNAPLVANKSRSDPLGIGDALKPLVEVAVYADRNLESGEISKLPVDEPVNVLQVGAPGKPGQRWVRIKTAAGEIGWVNYLSESGARIFSVEKKADRPKKPPHKRPQKRPQQPRPPIAAARAKPWTQAQKQAQRKQQAKPRRPPPGAAASWGKGAKPKMPPQAGRPGKPGKPVKPGKPPQRNKRAVPGGFSGPKPNVPRPATKPQRPGTKASTATAGKRQKRAKR